MPVARFVRLLMALFVLVGGPLSALGANAWAAPLREAAAARSAASNAISGPRARDCSEPTRALHRAESSAQARLSPNVGDSATPAGSDTLRPASRGRAGLLSLLSRALGDDGGVDGGTDAEFEMGDDPDAADDDGPQGFVAAASAELWTPRLPAPYLEPNLWGIQPSTGHPRGDDEPPRI